MDTNSINKRKTDEISGNGDAIEEFTNSLAVAQRVPLIFPHPQNPSGSFSVPGADAVEITAPSSSQPQESLPLDPMDVSGKAVTGNEESLEEVISPLIAAQSQQNVSAPPQSSGARVTLSADAYSALQKSFETLQKLVLPIANQSPGIFGKLDTLTTEISVLEKSVQSMPKAWEARFPAEVRLGGQCTKLPVFSR
jgi:hypothetical protein